MKNGETKGARPGFWERLLGRGRATEAPNRNGLNAAGKACRDTGSGRMGLEADRSGRRAGETMTITLPGGAAMEMVWCPPGSFLMGSPESEEGREDNERQHRVTLTKGFWLAKYPVTQAQWQSVMGDNPFQTDYPDGTMSDYPGDTMPVNFMYPGHQGWYDNSQAFCEKAGLRLPTEAEWEYACRAGSTGPYAGTGRLGDMGWFEGNSGGQPHPVGEKQPNAWGLYDMHGNVWECCEDLRGEYPVGAVTDPKEASSGWGRVCRGGSYHQSAQDCRSAYRGSGRMMSISCSSALGFRPARNGT